MIDLKRPAQKPVVVIRAATGHELSTYEKNKLAKIEEYAQVNKIEVIKLNGNQLPISNKEVNIDLGALADKDAVTPSDISSKDLFFIKCMLEEDIETGGEN
jgi:hypothetical protein